VKELKLALMGPERVATIVASGEHVSYMITDVRSVPFRYA